MIAGRESLVRLASHIRLRHAAAGLGALLALSAIGVAAPAAGPVKIAVFDFELSDRSAGGGVVGQDAVDAENLRAATALAREMLASSGRYAVVGTDKAGAAVAAQGGIRSCNGCEAGLAKGLGAEQSMAGLITRVNRTEYTLQLLVRDTQTGAVVSNDFTGLRMGANYAWPRGVRWLMDNRFLTRTAP